MAPIAKNYFHQALHYFFPGNCFEELFVNLNILHPKCAPLLLSRLLGVGITLGSTFLLLPQIIKIHGARSGHGVSLSSQLLGLVAAAGTAAYSYEKGFIFGQWGDSLFVALQTVIIVMQLFYFSNNKASAFAFMACCWCCAVAIVYHYVPLAILSWVQASTVPIVFASKGIQITHNYQNSGTGQLSTISVALQFLGCVARVFTSIQETSGDWMVIGPYILASVLNGIIFGQILYYHRVNKGGRGGRGAAGGKKKRH